MATIKERIEKLRKQAEDAARQALDHQRVAAQCKEEKYKLEKQARKTQQEIDKRNKLFKQATKAERRVMIAKDVLAQIKAGLLEPAFGDWLVVNTTGNDPEIDDSFQAALIAKEQVDSCSCCALGGLFVSCTLFANKVETSDVLYDFDLATSIRERESTSSALRSVFSTAQLRLIETFFENGHGAFVAYDQSHGTQDKLYGFTAKYSLPEARMVAIMKNIIKNNGTFIP